MIAFTVFILVGLWFAQIVLLGNFHYWNIKNRMAENAYRLAMDVGDADFEKTIEDIAENGEACVVVYRIEEETVSVIYNYEESPSCMVHRLDSAVVKDISENASGDGGLLQIRLSDLIKEWEKDGGTPVKKPSTDRLLTVLVVSGTDGQYMLFLDAALFPVESTVGTLRYQLIYISIALFLVATILSFILSSYIASPIEHITEKSKKLPRGEYQMDANVRSYREIEELSETLSHAADEISKVDRLQKELIANISHDLRTPLTMIIGYGEVMRDIEGENTPENVQVIIDEATRLSSLVNDLLEISRIQGGDIERHDEVFDFSALMHETVERYRRLKENSGFVFTDAIEDHIVVKADKSKILQVVYNLINNAINYSMESRKVHIRLYSIGAKMHFDVVDYGVGIAAEDLENIWQRYYKVDKIHRRSSSGSGLGLSIVREILDLHGARYGVQSKLGMGSTFWFELPLYEEEENKLLLD